MTRAPAAAAYRFGPFEARVESGELFKDGTRVTIQDKPFRLLVVLLESPGRVVTREEVQRRIWSSDTFVDFDSSLRVAVRKLRDALGDPADSPQFVETIPKRGYRFLRPVTRVEDEPTGSREQPAATPSRGPRTWRRVIVALLIVAVAASLLALTRRRDRPAGETVVIADFTNATGDPVFDGVLRQGLTVALEQSRAVTVLSDERIQRTLGLMGDAGAARLTSALAFDVCRRTATDAVVDGSIAGVGSAYVLALRARDCRTGEIVHQEQLQAARKEDVLPALDRAAARFRSELGEAFAVAPAPHDPPLVDATTPSLDAWNAYGTGWQASASKGAAAAIPFFKRAVELDPQFAMAHSALGLMYSTNGEAALAAESAARGYALRDRVSDHERFFISGYYDGRVTGNMEKAQQTCDAWARAYPRDSTPHDFLAGFIDIGLGKLDIARDDAQMALDLDPDDVIGYVHLAQNLLYLEQPDGAGRVLRLAAERQLESPQLAVLRYDLAFYRRDAAGMSAESAGRTQADADDWMSQRQAFVAAYGGRLREAENLSQRAQAIATEADQAERAELFSTLPVLWRAWFGDAATARAAAPASPSAVNSREVQYGAALALAVAGDTIESGRIADALAARFPNDTGVQFSYVPTIRAVDALNRHDPAAAIQQLEIARAHELAIPRSRIQAFFGALYPAYVRGEAYLAARRGTDAAEQFLNIIDHRGIVLSDPVGALAHLGLGRAYAISGDAARARKAYDDFLALWKDADQDLTVVRQAREEYTKLAR